MSNNNKYRLLILIVAYQAESTIEDVLSRIPVELKELLDVEILILDDSSPDETFAVSQKIVLQGNLPYKTKVLYNPVNQGYGGNQKIGYHYAIQEEFDFVALLHGDGQYAPECLMRLVMPLVEGAADAVFGSRMLVKGAARNGGMPLYKFVGNRILTSFQNWILRSDMTEYHSGYRIYSVKALSSIPFHLNTNDFHFDTEIIIQFIFSKLRILEIPIPTYYGDEICRVNGIKYAAQVALAVLQARAQSFGIFFKSKYNCVGLQPVNYQSKFGYKSPHSQAASCIPNGSRVLDLGCAGGYVGQFLRDKKNCFVVGVDLFPLDPKIKLDHFIHHDLNMGLPNINWDDFEYVLLLDVVEHLSEPEVFIKKLYGVLGEYPHVKIIASTGNIAFILNRLMLFFGQFNYGSRGILDMTHKRLFTFATFKRLFTQHGFVLKYSRGIPAPYPLAFGKNFFSSILLNLNEFLIMMARSLFSYQIFFILESLPSLQNLLSRSVEEAAMRKKVKSISSDLVT